MIFGCLAHCIETACLKMMHFQVYHQSVVPWLDPLAFATGMSREVPQLDCKCGYF